MPTSRPNLSASSKRRRLRNPNRRTPGRRCRRNDWRNWSMSDRRTPSVGNRQDHSMAVDSCTITGNRSAISVPLWLEANRKWRDLRRPLWNNFHRINNINADQISKMRFGCEKMITKLADILQCFVPLASRSERRIKLRNQQSYHNLSISSTVFD